MWTKFWDMHSGGGLKEQWDQIYIEAPKEEAAVIFQNRFGHNPHRVTCTCCGSDYSLSEYESLEQATGFDRNCEYIIKGGDEGSEGRYHEVGQPVPDGWMLDDRWGRSHDYIPLDEYLKLDSILIIRALDIQPEERMGKLRQQGYVWLD